jgi:hypothetical protein
MNISEEYRSNITVPAQFMAITDGQNIYKILNYIGTQREQVGVTLAKYKELEKYCNEYYTRLVELGEIVPEKSKEEMQAEQMAKQTEAINAMLAAMQNLTKEVEAIKNGREINSKDAEPQYSKNRTAEPSVDEGAGAGDGHNQQSRSFGRAKK